jgi:cold shock CspA family protein
MSIPGKVLIALLCALATAAAFSTLNPELPLLGLLPPAVVAALSAVILSHRALPMPSALAAGAGSEPPAPQPAKGNQRQAGSPAQKGGKARGREREKDRGRDGASGDRKRRSDDSGRGRTAPRAAPGSNTRSEGERAPAAKAAAAAADTTSAADLEEGTVKWFNVTKGYGFIIRQNGDEIFVHHRSVQGDGRGRLEDGAAVRFRVATTDKGPQAEDVQAI